MEDHYVYIWIAYPLKIHKEQQEACATFCGVLCLRHFATCVTLCFNILMHH